MHASLCTRTLSQSKSHSEQHRLNGYDRPLPTLFVRIQLSNDSKDTVLIKVLVDSGASETVVGGSLLKALKKKKLPHSLLIIIITQGLHFLLTIKD